MPENNENNITELINQISDLKSEKTILHEKNVDLQKKLSGFSEIETYHKTEIDELTNKFETEKNELLSDSLSKQKTEMLFDFEKRLLSSKFNELSKKTNIPEQFISSFKKDFIEKTMKNAKIQDDKILYFGEKGNVLLNEKSENLDYSDMVSNVLKDYIVQEQDNGAKPVKTEKTEQNDITQIDISMAKNKIVAMRMFQENLKKNGKKIKDHFKEMKEFSERNDYKQLYDF